MRAYPKRLAAAVLALALATVSLFSYNSWSRSRERLTDLLEALGTGAREPGVLIDVRREPDILRARLMVARALLADELDRRWLAELPAEQRDQAEALSRQKLAVARSMAVEALERRPASWQARMILAGATYLIESRRGDPRRWSNRASWEAPLISAMQRAPSQAEPARILGAAYLNEWSLMTPEEKQFAVEVLRKAFQDRSTLEQLLAAWLGRADSLEQAFELIPADTISWKRVENHFIARNDWQRVCQARLRGRAILTDYFDDLLDQAATRLAGGDLRVARYHCVQVLESVPVGPEHARTLIRTLETLPPGPIPPGPRRRARLWLEWAHRECLLNTCPLPEATVRRLQTLGQFRASSDAAWLAELAGNVGSANYYARTALVPRTEEWTPYLLQKANRLVAEGKPGEAEETLSLIHPDWAERAVARSVRRRIRQSQQPAKTKQELDDWQSESISQERRVWFREYFWQKPPDKVRLGFGYVDPAGAAVEISWSSRLQGCRAVDPGARLSIEAPDSGGFHTVEIEPIAGRRARPTAIELID